MFQLPPLKHIFGKASRSGFHYVLTAIRPVKRPTEMENGFDALGGLMMAGLSTAAVLLMRVMLAN